MAKKLLSLEEINRLAEILVELFAYIKRLKREAIAEHVQYPKIPSILSESLVIHLIRRRKLLSNYSIEGAELSTEDNNVVCYFSNGKKIKIEVKATASSGFQNFSQKDLDSDLLIWVHFGNYFKQPDNSKIIVYCLPQPSMIFKEPRKITLGTFLENSQNHIQTVEIEKFTSW